MEELNILGYRHVVNLRFGGCLRHHALPVIKQLSYGFLVYAKFNCTEFTAPE